MGTSLPDHYLTLSTEEGAAFDEAVEASQPPKRDKGIVDGYGRDFVLKVEENYASDAAGSYFEKDWGKYVDYSKENDKKDD